jgi:predicted nucleic acid-binding protein
MNQGWLIDKSALIRLRNEPSLAGWLPIISRGLVRISTPTLLELGFSAASLEDMHEVHYGHPVDLMPMEYLTPRAEQRAAAVQVKLAENGQHRALSVPDLLVAALAETAGLTLLHDDKDFELIADLTGQYIQSIWNIRPAEH